MVYAEPCWIKTGREGVKEMAEGGEEMPLPDFLVP